MCHQMQWKNIGCSERLMEKMNGNVATSIYWYWFHRLKQNLLSNLNKNKQKVIISNGKSLVWSTNLDTMCLISKSSLWQCFLKSAKRSRIQNSNTVPAFCPDFSLKLSGVQTNEANEIGKMAKMNCLQYRVHYSELISQTYIK